MPGGFPRAPGSSPLPGGAGAPGRRDPFGLGAPPPQQQARPRAPEPSIIIDDSLPENAGGEEISLDLGGAAPVAARPAARAPSTAPAANGDAQLREALSKASREMIEKIVWEIVPQLAETIIRQELDRLVKEREGRS